MKTSIRLASRGLSEGFASPTEAPASLGEALYKVKAGAFGRGHGTVSQT